MKVSLRDKLVAARDRAKAENDLSGRQEVLDAWAQSVARLNNEISNWSQSYVNDGLMNFGIERHRVTEEPFGEYNLQTATLQAGNQKIIFQPIARFVAGSNGRVDMFAQGRGDPTERYRLLLKSHEGEDDRWAIIRPVNFQNSIERAMGWAESSAYTVLGRASFEEALSNLLG